MVKRVLVLHFLFKRASNSKRNWFCHAQNVSNRISLQRLRCSMMSC